MIIIIPCRAGSVLLSLIGIAAVIWAVFALTSLPPPTQNTDYPLKFHALEIIIVCIAAYLAIIGLSRNFFCYDYCCDLPGLITDPFSSFRT